MIKISQIYHFKITQIMQPDKESREKTAKTPNLLDQLKENANKKQKERALELKDLNIIVESNSYSKNVQEIIAKSIIKSLNKQKLVPLFFIESCNDEYEVLKKMQKIPQNASESYLFFKQVSSWFLLCLVRKGKDSILRIYGEESNKNIRQIINKIQKFNINYQRTEYQKYWKTSLRLEISAILCLKNFEHYFHNDCELNQLFMDFQINKDKQLKLIKSDLKVYAIQELINQTLKKVEKVGNKKQLIGQIKKMLYNADILNQKLEQPTQLFSKKLEEEGQRMNKDQNYIPSNDFVTQLDNYKKIVMENKDRIESLPNKKQDLKQNDKEKKQTSKQNSEINEALQLFTTILKIMRGVQRTQKSQNLYKNIATTFEIDVFTLEKYIKRQGMKKTENETLEKLPIPIDKIQIIDKLDLPPNILDRKDKEILELVCEKFQPKQKDQFLQYFQQIQHQCQKWSKKSKLGIYQWSLSHKNKLMNIEEKLQCIAVLNRAYELIKGFSLRSTQISAVLSFIITEANIGKLLQVETGEGKTTIVYLIAAIKALEGYSVDVITSNEVLASEGVDSNQKLFGLLGLSVACNNKEKDVNKKKQRGIAKQCYSANIVYGNISNFQFDYLTHEFERKGTRGNRNFGYAILDEVDSMIIDNGNHIAKLAEPFPGMSYLQYAYIQIWKALIEAEDEEIQSAEKRIQQLKKKLANDQSPDTEKQLKFEVDKIQIYNSASQNIKKAVINKKPVDLSMIPFHLHSYCENTLEKWVDNAMLARYKYTEKEDYILKKDTDQAETKIVPVDYLNTGVTLQNTQWGSGLHQFLQLKHNTLLTNQSLTTCFISNLGYIKLYENRMYGMTGTLGSTVEQEFFKQIYRIQFGKIPTFREKKLKNWENTLMTDQTWMAKIITSAFQQVETYSKSVLIICKTIKDLRQLEKHITLYRDMVSNRYLVKIKTYQDESESKITKQTVDICEIIIATNIAGRGTDLKTSKSLEANGGLHVIISFLPSNERVEFQAIGRTARQGNLGTYQIILKQSEISEVMIVEEKQDQQLTFTKIFDNRNKCEKKRLQEIKKKRVPDINFKDNIFKLFMKEVQQIQKKILDDQGHRYVLDDIKELWAFWLLQFDINKTDKKFDAAEEYAKFQKMQSFKQNLEGKISFNFFNAVNQSEFYLAIQKKDKAEKSLKIASKIAQGQKTLGARASIFMKQFELQIEHGDQLMHRFKKALASLIFIQVSSNTDYKNNARNYLQQAKKEVEAEKKFFQEKIFGKEKSNESHRFYKILTTSKQNEFVKHLVSKFNCLDLVSQQINGLLESITKSNNQGIAINQRIPNFFKNLEPENKDEQSVGKVINSHVFSELGQIGLQVTYSLKNVYDVSQETIIGVQAQIATGLAALGVAIAFPWFAPILGPAAGTLISEGLCDLAFDLLSQGDTKFDLKAYLKGKAISYAVSIASFGLSAIASSVKIMNKAIGICRKMAKWLKESKHCKWLCNKLANIFEKLAAYLTKVAYLARIQKLERVQTFGQKVIRSTVINISEKTAHNVANHLIMNYVVNKGLNSLLDLIKKSIDQKVNEIIEALVNKANLKRISDEQFNEALKGIIEKTLSQEIKECLIEALIGVLQGCNHWKFKLLATSTQITRCILQVSNYTKEFCYKFNQILDEFTSSKQEKNKQKHEKQKSQSTQIQQIQAEKKKAEINKAKQIFESRLKTLKQTVSADIKNLIQRLLSSLASNYVVSPLLKKGEKLLKNLFKKPNLSQELAKIQKNEEKINLSDIQKALKILGIEKSNPTKEDIDKAFKKLARQNHPDKNKNPGAEEKFKQINGAHKLLKNSFENTNKNQPKQPLAIENQLSQSSRKRRPKPLAFQLRRKFGQYSSSGVIVTTQNQHHSKSHQGSYNNIEGDKQGENLMEKQNFKEKALNLLSRLINSFEGQKSNNQNSQWRKIFDQVQQQMRGQNSNLDQKQIIKALELIQTGKNEEQKAISESKQAIKAQNEHKYRQALILFENAKRKYQKLQDALDQLGEKYKDINSDKYRKKREQIQQCIEELNKLVSKDIDLKEEVKINDNDENSEQQEEAETIKIKD